MIRVAFTLIGGKNWTGGHNYLMNLLRVLGQNQAERLTPVLLVGEACVDADVEAFSTVPGIELVRTPLLNTKRRSCALIQALLWGRDVAMHDLFLSHRINLVFEAAHFFGWRLGLPAIAWIPDFQHRAMPQMFSAPAWLKREIGLRAQVLGQRFIMLSSENMRQACEQYYPTTRGRTRTVHFAVPPQLETPFTEARKIADDYGLPEHFFFMPNQFWKHKNHSLVAEAMAILRARGINVVVAAPGKQHDPRDLGHFQRLQALVTRLGVQDEIRFLGEIPYPHLIALMRTSIALLNPSLFEGWSTTVEEARALGVPMILSDLEVHREQMGKEATYFDRYSAQSLADTLKNFQVMDKTRRKQLSSKAKHSADKLVRRFAEDFVCFTEDICKEARL